jgi:hypothetical protein
VSGELNASAVPTRPGFAKLPGVVTFASVDGWFPAGGSFQERSTLAFVFGMQKLLNFQWETRAKDGIGNSLPYAGTTRIRF